MPNGAEDKSPKSFFCHKVLINSSPPPPPPSCLSNLVGSNDDATLPKEANDKSQNWNNF